MSHDIEVTEKKTFETFISNINLKKKTHKIVLDHNDAGTKTRKHFQASYRDCPQIPPPQNLRGQ